MSDLGKQTYVLACALAGDLKPLIFQLENTDYELNRAEREFLASFLRGNIKKNGRPKLSPRVKWEAREIYNIICWLTDEGTQRDHAYDQAAAICGISRATVISRLNLLTEEDMKQKKLEIENLSMVRKILDQESPPDGTRIFENWRERVLSRRSFKAKKV